MSATTWERRIRPRRVQAIRRMNIGQTSSKRYGRWAFRTLRSAPTVNGSGLPHAVGVVAARAHRGRRRWHHEREPTGQTARNALHERNNDGWTVATRLDRVHYAPMERIGVGRIDSSHCACRGDANVRTTLRNIIADLVAFAIVASPMLAGIVGGAL
jgi:hypothetical protein